jgi:photosystem II stability/assembly factor-like uncharacterized protein
MFAVSRPLRALVLLGIATTLAGSAPAPLAAQEDPAVQRVLDQLHFREIGPAIMGGRVAGMAIHPDEPSKWFVGFASGGLWVTENHGTSWTPLFDDQSTASIGAVALSPSNPNVVWVGTGEPQNRQSSPYGGGVFRSVDGGRTWTDLGLTETRHISRILVHPRNPDVAWVAAVGHLWGANPERGVYRTLDGGATWEQVLFIDDDTGAIDMSIDPNDPNTIFVAMYQRRRTVFGFSASGGGSGLYRTLDGGDTWHELREGLPEGDLGRMGVDVWAGDGNLVYLSVEAANQRDRGLYRSTDRGESWERMSSQNPRPMYFSMVRIDPNNPNRIYMGGVSLPISDDGGKTWWEYDGYTEIHVDYHALGVDPANSDHVIVGNDGGVASTWDGAKNWTHHNNLAVGQFYEIGVDMRDPYFVCGGLQDNSSWCAPSNKLDEYGIGNRDWYDVSGGDGFYNQIDPTDWRWVYTESQGGNISRYNAMTGETARIRPIPQRGPGEAGDPDQAPAEGEDEADIPNSYDFNWNAPIVVSRHDPSTIYIGANHLLRSRDRGQTWEEASPDLTAGIDRDSLEIMGRRLSEPHLSRNDGISRYGTITTVDESPLDGDVVWVGTDDGQVQLTRDGGASWTNVTGNVPGLPGRRYVSRIEASTHEPGRAYLTFDGHYDDDYSPYVFRTETFGEDWERITTGLPNESVNVIREHHARPWLLFAGNEVGVWVSLNRGERWNRLSGNLPTVPVDDLVIHPRENDLVVGTHGRSIWILDDLMVLEHLSDHFVETDAYFVPPRQATLWSRSGGWPFWGDNFFGENPPDGAVLRFHVPDHNDVDSVTVTITDGAGATVRSERLEATPGLTRWVWDLRHDAPDVPENAGGGGFGFGGPPRGPTVLPGEYTATVDAGSVQPQQPVSVRVDPRVETTDRDLRARQAALMEVHALSGPAGHARARIRDLQEQLAEVSDLLSPAVETADGEDDAGGDAGDAGAGEGEGDSASDPHADLRETLESLESRLRELNEAMGDVTPATRLTGTIEGHFGSPTGDQLFAIDRAWDSLSPILDGINELIESEIPAFYEELDRQGIRPDPGATLEMPRRPRGR